MISPRQFPPLRALGSALTVLTGIVLLASSAGAAAVDYAEALKLLEKSTRAEIAKKKPAAGDERSDYYARGGDRGALLLGQLRNSIARGDSQSVDEMLNQFAAAFTSEEVAAAVRQVRELAQAEIEAKKQGYLKKVREALASAAQAVKTATKTADLDQALVDLDAARDQPQLVNSSALQAEANKISNARQFVVYWQDYLSSLASGDTKTALQKLENASNASVPDVLPRSEILARMDFLKNGPSKNSGNEFPQIMERLRSLDDIAAVLAALNEAAPRNPNPDPSRSRDWWSELQNLGRAYAQFQAGLPIAPENVANAAFTASSEYLQPLLTLRAQLLRLIIARHLQVADRLKPAADEAIADYLVRLIADARERCDARFIQRVIDLQGRINLRPANESAGALQSLLAAQNQEEAGQFLPAIISYQAALKTGGDAISPKAIGARLDALKAAHPEEFEKTVQP